MRRDHADGKWQKRILTNIQAVLGAAGATLGDAVKVNIYLADMSQFAAVNAVYETFFQSPRPARTCVSFKGLPYGTDVEMECVANAVAKA
ncbi:Putative YjgF/YER057c/UK114 family, RutC-like superfamily protein [Colletotrichum destructivum]|uniref:YjgF/YER057c/UK114 family, RutC-like superfamily protein n=1 Tax=Colletotrichum destructivum TaxID=34406 RepID=A0AAX4IE35_9PEZI|nr:Putative YjgF/YER057c/UK114 family, RutC-like superfamily protein [Colletotrichum destructivum]